MTNTINNTIKVPDSLVPSHLDALAYALISRITKHLTESELPERLTADITNIIQCEKMKAIMSYSYNAYTSTRSDCGKAH
jgi:hypothetical protein